MVKVSPAGVAKIREREGYRLHAYQDTVGVWTIGVGHTGRMSGAKVTPGMVITTAEADTLLAADLAPVEAAIAAHVGATLAQHQVDALASLAFNIGVSGFVGSTVVHKLNAGDVRGAADAFLKWERPAVLKARREGERAQFLGAETASKSIGKNDMAPTSSGRSGPAPEVRAPNSGGPRPCTRALCPFRKAA